MHVDASRCRLAECTDRRRLLIAGDVGFPNGTGAEARIHAYAKGLRAAGCEVKVVCLRWSERSAEGAKNRQADGLYHGIPFTYSSGSPYRAATFTRRRLRDARSALRFARLVRGTLAQPAANVILFSNSALWIVMTVAMCRLAGSACVIEKSEYPFVYAPDTTLTRVWARVFTKTVYRLVDGVIVISTCLERYFLAHVRRGARVIRVPILVDLDEFDLSPADDAPGRDILCYVGHLDHPGEIDSLLAAFGEIAARFPQWSLRIIGGSSDPRTLDRFRARAADLGLGERVEFTGRVERAELPGLLGEATAFALPRASELFSTAGFPTKLGEYLATAKPVVVTSTGDIPLYLRDGVDAYLVPPDDTPAFAARLAEMFADPLAAREVGARGRETARREFEVVSQCRRLAAFMVDVGSSGARSQPPPEST
jgi:glycosyltransferase involved in cell wall biosynthesis